MDVRLAILAGTFLLLIASIVGFIVTLVRAAREPQLPPAATPYPWPALPPAPNVQVDTSLEGLHVEVGEDALSASLLTPLRTGEWVPDAVPAAAAELPNVSLDRRIESFEPIPDIREPAFSAETVDEWKRETPAVQPAVAEKVELSAEPAPSFEFVTPAAPVVAAPPEPVAAQPVVVSPVEPLVAPEQQVAPVLEAAMPPEPTLDVQAEPQFVEVPEPASAVSVTFPERSGAESAPEVSIVIPEVRVEPSGDEAEREFDAEIAALLSVVEPEPAAPEPIATLVAELVVPEPVAAPAPVAAPQSIPVPVSVAAPRPIPATEPVAAPEATVADASVSVPATDENELWQSMLREEQGLPSIVTLQTPVASRQEAVVSPASVTVQPPVVAPPVPAVPRPAAVVHEPPVSVPAPAPAAPASRRKPRPAVRVAGAIVAPVEFEAPSSAPAVVEQERAGIPEIHMAAPVEMWFGEHRVGVKAGTATYDRFRKYADVLLGDLRSSRGAGV